MSFRLLFLLAIAWFAWLTLRRWLQGAQTQARNSAAGQTQRPPAGVKVVQCRYCSLYLPEPEAQRQNNEWFCCAEHAKLYLGKR
ncbi:MAG: hypothetical protein LBE21_08710 [Pseudomonadales bacterium]|nr:hypothetical protein [Pseudomonadales bacterium]